MANETEHTDELLVDESGKFKELTFRKIKGQDKRFRRKILSNKLNKTTSFTTQAARQKDSELNFSMRPKSLLSRPVINNDLSMVRPQMLPVSVKDCLRKQIRARRLESQSNARQRIRQCPKSILQEQDMLIQLCQEDVLVSGSRFRGTNQSEQWHSSRRNRNTLPIGFKPGDHNNHSINTTDPTNCSVMHQKRHSSIQS